MRKRCTPYRAKHVCKKCKTIPLAEARKKGDLTGEIGILATVHREFSENEPEIMDLPGQDEAALRLDLENLGRLNRTFGGRSSVQKMFRALAEAKKRLLLVDLASGFGDQGRNLIAHAREQGCELGVVAVDRQFDTLRLAREATPAHQRMLFVQADARQLPFRARGADLVFCSLALHHFSDADAVSVLREMKRVGRMGAACVDLVRGRVAAFCIWLLTAVVMRHEMTRHDARLSIRRAFNHAELLGLAKRAGWGETIQTKFFWFQQAIRTRLRA
jgi:ubiquinone/menaquinone biosynthesis C-methylase UbiE